MQPLRGFLHAFPQRVQASAESLPYRSYQNSYVSIRTQVRRIPASSSPAKPAVQIRSVRSVSNPSFLPKGVAPFHFCRNTTSHGLGDPLAASAPPDPAASASALPNAAPAAGPSPAPAFTAVWWIIPRRPSCPQVRSRRQPHPIRPFRHKAGRSGFRSRYL